ncbi:hypothetical protein PQG98_08720 [Bacteroides zhangwenhongii]|uniref:Lipoprotein n=1 Tax=Bacteroides zhangwenhongii TaxID=2650157 RepID=A0ABT5H763_9BACE|nr:hypothetical protein [Bacteroides zhangwenhongii]MDC7136423.1 hypothetical protein [Bacteroides zhangwenhongii]OKZ22701.1 MAG: hypothetical protein BHV74_08895 [Bacteroides finegoldii]
MRKHHIITRIFLATGVLFCLFLTACGNDNGMDDINPDMPSEQTPHFLWDTKILLEKPNGWGLLVQLGSVAITNLTEGKQYRLLWQGDWSTGKKATPILKIVEKGKQTEIIALKQLEVSVIKDGHYSLTFGSDDREGELVLAK